MPGELKIDDIPVGNTVYLTSQGTAWNGINEGWTICSDNDLLNITLTGYSPFWLDFITDDGPGSGEDGTIVHGKYKLQMGSNIVYIDWRDCDYQDLNSFGTGYNTADIIIRWNAGTSHFEHRDHYNGTTWYGISQDSTVGIWDGNRKNNTIPAYDHFQPTIPHNLSYTPNNNHPELMWNASEPYNSNVTYIIRRKKPNQSTFAIIASGITDTTFIDTDVTLCCGSQIVTYQYTVEAVSGDGQNYSSECGQISVTVKEGNFAKK